jgi:hypothetical protein
MKWSPTNIAKTFAPWATTLATVLVAWWTYSARMEELRIERLKLEKELERRVNQVESMRSALYE